MHVVAGLDLSSSPNRPSGLVVLEGLRIIYMNLLRYDEDILEIVKTYRPTVLAIDSPLSHAEGFREVDLVMKRMGYRVLPPGWRSMKRLVDRCLAIKKRVENENVYIIETHPSSCLKSSRCYGYDSLLAEFNWMEYLGRSKDELDALICALTAYFYVENRALKVEARDGIIYLLPRICSES